MIKNTYKFIAMALMAVVFMPGFAMALSYDESPEVSIIGVVGIHDKSAAIDYTYDSNGGDYGSVISYIEYKNIETGETMTSYTTKESSGFRKHSISIGGLDPNTEYSYRAVIKYPEGTVKSTSKTFKTLGAAKYTGTYTTTQSGTNTTTTTNTNTVTVIDVPKVVTNITTSAKNSIMTGGGTHKNGVGLSITNEQARTSVDDTFTYTIKYQNTNSTSLRNAELVIQLPERYEFVKSSVDMDYDETDNTVSYSIGRIAPSALKTLTFTARAIGDGKGEIRTTATLFYEGGSISATDRDAFNGGSKSVLGASVFGAGFFPQTLGGWIAIILLIAAIIIIARRYMVAAPKQMVYVQHPAQPQPQK